MAKILIGITGSVAAVKTVSLIRLLIKANHEVKVVLTNDGSKFVSPSLLSALGVEVYSDQLIDYSNTHQAMAHIDLAKYAELIIIAPASANTLAKCAVGIADNLLTQIILAYSGFHPIIFIPAMNQAMWDNKLTQKNIARLQAVGHKIISPAIGLQACGDFGIGCLPEVDEIMDFVESQLNPKTNQKKLVISLGATVEPLDPVRYISNYSSGKMGLALVEAALDAGFEVVAICGKMTKQLTSQHKNLTVCIVLTAIEMLNHIDLHVKDAHVFISCAAVCDYRVKMQSLQKIKKSNDDGITLELIKNPDIVATIARKYTNLFCVGFVAETNDVILHAKNKLMQKSLKMIVANDVSGNQVFGNDFTNIAIINAIQIIYSKSNLTKNNAAEIIIQYILSEYDNAGS